MYIHSNTIISCANIFKIKDEKYFEYLIVINNVFGKSKSISIKLDWHDLRKKKDLANLEFHKMF